MRDCTITVFSIATVLGLWITPFITYSKMNAVLSSQVCPPSNDSSIVCCGGAEPNFILEDFSFSYEYDGDIISGLYVQIQQPTTQYWIRIVAFNVLLTIGWITYAILESCYRYEYKVDTSCAQGDILRQVFWFTLVGVAASLVFMYGGPSFPYEFRGFSDSNVFVKYNDEFIQVANLQLVHEQSTYRGEQHGLNLVATKNFTGIDAYKVPGPWVREILPLREWKGHGVQRSMRLRDECVDQMTDIIILDGGNIIIPIAFITTLLMVYLAAPDNAPARVQVPAPAPAPAQNPMATPTQVSGKPPTPVVSVVPSTPHVTIMVRPDA